jgi:hypothetical protein
MNDKQKLFKLNTELLAADKYIGISLLLISQSIVVVIKSYISKPHGLLLWKQ